MDLVYQEFGVYFGVLDQCVVEEEVLCWCVVVDLFVGVIMVFEGMLQFFVGDGQVGYVGDVFVQCQLVVDVIFRQW